jgi:hypothetical protein
MWVAARTLNLSVYLAVRKMLDDKGSTDYIKKVLLLWVDFRRKEGTLEFLDATQAYNLLDVSPKRAHKFPQKHANVGCL